MSDKLDAEVKVEAEDFESTLRRRSKRHTPREPEDTPSLEAILKTQGYWKKKEKEEFMRTGELRSVHANFLRLAILKRNDALAADLFAQGRVEVNQKLPGKWTLLLYAANAASASLVQLFLDAGADVTVKDKKGNSVLMVLSNPNNEKCRILATVPILLKANADVNQCNSTGLTPLMFAVKERQVELLCALIEAGADLNAQDRMGRTGLIIAAQAGFGQLAAILLEHGADANLLTEEGATACEMAMSANHDELASLLYEAKKFSGRPEQKLINLIASFVPSTSLQLPPKVNIFGETEGDKMEIFLSQLGLTRYLDLFHASGVVLMDILRFTDAKLKTIGVDNIGHRYKIMDAVRDIHNRNWTDEALVPIDKQEAMSTTQSTVVLLNMTRHLEYMGTTFDYLGAHMNSGASDKMEGNHLQDLKSNLHKARTSAADLKIETQLFKKFLLEIKERIALRRGDEIGPLDRKRSKWIWWVGGSFAVCCCTIFIANRTVGPNVTLNKF